MKKYITISVAETSFSLDEEKRIRRKIVLTPLYFLGGKIMAARNYVVFVKNGSTRKTKEKKKIKRKDVFNQHFVSTSIFKHLTKKKKQPTTAVHFEGRLKLSFEGEHVLYLFN